MSLPTTIAGLSFAHLLADYPLQGDFLARMKGQNFLLLLTHCGIWTGVITVAALLLGLHVPMWMVGFLLLVHIAADYAKAKPWGIYRKLDPMRQGLWLDQTIHLAQLLILIKVTL